MYDGQVINQLILKLLITKLRNFSGPGAGMPCVFPFKFDNVTAYGCILWGEDDYKVQYHFCSVYVYITIILNSAMVLYEGG